MPTERTVNTVEPLPSHAHWEHFPHGADVGVRGFGASPSEAFEQAAHALTAVVTEAEIRPGTSVEVSAHAADIQILLVEWLNAVIFEMAVRQMLFGNFDVRLEGTDLEATLWGEPVDVARHSPACEPKGATCTALSVQREADGSWSAGCVVDV